MFSNEDRLDYRHKAYANSVKAWRRENPHWEEQERKSEEYAENDFVWEEKSEVGFDKWFNGNYGKFSCRSEWFYGDCEVKDEKIRKDLLYNWVRSAYMCGYELGGTEK